MPLLTSEDIRRHSPFAWVCLAAMAGVSVWFWTLDRQSAAKGVAAALAGCLALVLPPRERMDRLPWRVRALPRRLDAVPMLAALLSSPGYGLNWFYGANPYDETVHLSSGALAGAVFAALLLADGKRRSAWRLALAGAAFGLVLGVAWELFEASVDLSGDWTDTWTDVALTALGAAPGAALTGRPERAARRPDAGLVGSDPRTRGPAPG